MSRAKKSEEDKKVNLEKPDEKPASKKTEAKPAPKKAEAKPEPKKAEAKPTPKKAVVKSVVSSSLKVSAGDCVQNNLRDGLKGRVLSFKSNEQGFATKLTVSWENGLQYAISYLNVSVCKKC